MKQVEYYKNGNRTLRIKYEGIKKLLEKKDKEINRLHSIIKEVREYIEKEIPFYEKWHWDGTDVDVESFVMEILNKLQELKDSDKEC